MSTAESTDNSSTGYPLPLFSHLYLESELLSTKWREETERILARFPRARVVEIDNYQEFALRRSVKWSDQKRSPKLVLALKRSELLYPCSDVAPNFGHPHFYYSVPMQNCLYDCEYCYLQGMYPSANLLYFVNQSELIQEALQKSKELGQLYLCIAYDNDILALENLLGIARRWIEGARTEPRLTVEVRTKSANYKAISDLTPAENVILAWTLSPSDVIERFEAKTPPLEARLKSMAQAVQAGWRTRLCFDPLLPVTGWRESYRGLLERVDQLRLWEQVEDVSYGLFRMPKTFIRQARKARPDSALLHQAQETESRGYFTLAGTEQSTLLEFMGSELRSRLPAQKVWQT